MGIIMNDKPKVSVVLVTWAPTEERMDFLKATLESLENSSDVPYELIVVDNGPEKQTEYLKTKKIDKHIILEQNKGIGYGWNKGVEVAEGEYITLIDNDLLFQKDWLQEGIDLLEKYPDKNFVATTCFSSHNFASRYYRGNLDDYHLWSRSCTAATIFRKSDTKIFGKWAISPTPGTIWCNTMYRKRYTFISTIFPKVVHRGIFQSYESKALKRSGEWKKKWNL